MSTAHGGWASITVNDHGFYLFDGDDLAVESADWSNGLIATMDVGAMICTGIHTGTVRLHTEVLDTAPPDPGTTSWDEVIDASVHAPAGRLQLVTQGPDPGPGAVPLLSQAGPGWYRLRVAARGRDTAYDQVAHDVEDYLLTVWPAPREPDRIWKTTDQAGASLRHVATPAPAPAPAHEPAPRPAPRSQRSPAAEPPEAPGRQAEVNNLRAAYHRHHGKKPPSP